MYQERETDQKGADEDEKSDKNGRRRWREVREGLATDGGVPRSPGGQAPIHGLPTVPDDSQRDHQAIENGRTCQRATPDSIGAMAKVKEVLVASTNVKRPSNYQAARKRELGRPVSRVQKGRVGVWASRSVGPSRLGQGGCSSRNKQGRSKPQGICRGDREQGNEWYGGSAGRTVPPSPQRPVAAPP